MDQLKQWYLQNMDIQTWELRQDFSMDQKKPATLDHKIENTITTLDWQQLRRCVVECTACELHKTRTQTVFGVGSQQAELVIVGEAPGAQEDKLGEPFVGRAGKLLDEMLYAIGLNRQQIYIANILKCRPPNNRDPSPSEQNKCTPFLERQLALLQPKLILALGRISAQYLLQSNLTLGRLRNALHHFGPQKIPLIVSYHPAYLLRSPADKQKAYIDLLTAKNFLQQASESMHENK